MTHRPAGGQDHLVRRHLLQRLRERPARPRGQRLRRRGEEAFITTGDGVITIHPQDHPEAGKNATLGKFGHRLRRAPPHTTQLILPPAPGTRASTHGRQESRTTTARVPQRHPRPGKTGEVIVTYWPSATVSSEKADAVVDGDPQILKLARTQLFPWVSPHRDQAGQAARDGHPGRDLQKTAPGAAQPAPPTTTATTRATTTPTPRRPPPRRPPHHRPRRHRPPPRPQAKQ